jgi:release factor glutamine methyltransferase
LPAVATGRELSRLGRDALAARGVDSPGREAALLLAAVLECSPSELLARDDRPVDPLPEQRYRRLVERRAAGEPVAYLVGEREFYGRRFRVDRRVLVPRPETEHLVEIALGLPLPGDARVLDVGVGSGALAVTLAAERPRWKICAVDLSLGALAVAAANWRRLAAGARSSLVASDLAAALDLAAFDLVVSNPPYVDPGELETLPRDVRDFEPELALVSPGGGSRIAVRLLDEMRALRGGALLAFEIGAGQREAVVAEAGRAGAWELVEVRRDLAGIERDVVFRRATHG